MNWTAIIVFVLLFGSVTILGFLAANWRRGDLDQLHEWGLGGRRFGSIVIWFLLGLLALTGFMALATGVDKLPEFAPQFAQYKSNFAVPALILHAFPDWFAGFAFAAIGIGGLVPAAIMSIVASNLFTRNIYRQFIRPDCTPKQEAQNAKIVSLLVKLGALVFIIFLPLQYAIQLQLLGGIWISQTIPSVIVGLYPLAQPMGAHHRLGGGSSLRHLDGCIERVPVGRFPAGDRWPDHSRLRGALCARNQFCSEHCAVTPAQPYPRDAGHRPDICR